MHILSVSKAFQSSLRPLMFRRKKRSRSVSRSDPSSFSSESSSSSSCASISKGTPTSVLPRDSSDRYCFNSRFDEITEMFKFFDKDGDGKISRKEVDVVFARLGLEPPSEDEAAVLLEQINMDGDDCINLEAFGDLCSSMGPACSDDLRDAFDYFDADGDGRISPEELFTVFSTIGEVCTIEECRRMILGVDSDGDGLVCFNDFIRMMQSSK